MPVLQTPRLELSWSATNNHRTSLKQSSSQRSEEWVHGHQPKHKCAPVRPGTTLYKLKLNSRLGNPSTPQPAFLAAPPGTELQGRERCPTNQYQARNTARCLAPIDTNLNTTVPRKGKVLPCRAPPGPHSTHRCPARICRSRRVQPQLLDPNAARLPPRAVLSPLSAGRVPEGAHRSRRLPQAGTEPPQCRPDLPPPPSPTSTPRSKRRPARPPAVTPAPKGAPPTLAHGGAKRRNPTPGIEAAGRSTQPPAAAPPRDTTPHRGERRKIEFFTEKIKRETGGQTTATSQTFHLRFGGVEPGGHRPPPKKSLLTPRFPDVAAPVFQQAR